MSQYQTFTAEQAVAYAKEHSGLVDPSELVRAEEIGDGNLNLVFKIYDTQNVSRIIVKQALPYVRCVGESWPLTLDRARLEAQTLIEHYQHCPEHTVKVIHYDPEQYVIVMEDLSDHQIWRSGLIAGLHYPQAAQQLGEYLATVLFYSSDFYLHPHRKKELVAQFMNPQMCEITEDLFFNDPYMEHERNNYPAAIEKAVHALRDNSDLKVAVAELKQRFFSSPQALLHGDIHSGSIFVKSGSLKVIDAEFGFFGPMGFDLGCAIGNLLLNYCGAEGLFDKPTAQQAKAQRLGDIETLWSTFTERFSVLVKHHGSDQALCVDGYVSLFLRNIWRDTLGFAGTELIRRSMGLSHVADLDTISDEAQRHASLCRAIHLGRELILHTDVITDGDSLSAFVRRAF
ncbi:S-methyl-5-thioribose kinase [Celerinatantimonas yamalensis]|uniref:Methylthioribose kinase n=1 Tax=Celerinatantimonas yamalensis TaxID=559956 RepID=A0ABW9G7M7_9GAMM